MRLLIPLILFALSTASIACVDAPATDGELSTSTATAEDGRADSLDSLRVRAAGMTIWADPILVTDDDGFVLSARSSYSIAAVRASVGETALPASAISSRKFQVHLQGRALADVLEETPLLVELTTTSGRIRTAMFTARATFGASTGSSKLYPWKNLEPVVVGRESMFRGRLTTRGEFEAVYGWNDDDSEPIMRQEDATHWIADFPAYALPWAAHPTEDAVNFTAQRADGERFSRMVPIVIRVDSIGITSENPADAWPAPVCEQSVRSCVADHGPDADLEACGSVAEVRPCLADFPVDDTPRYHQKFANGLRSALIRHYAQYEADITAAGGNPRTEALRRVGTAKMTEVTEPDDAPTGRDLEEFRVFAHPDIVFPGSDTVWLGVFNRADGTLVEVFDFN